MNAYNSDSIEMITPPTPPPPLSTASLNQVHAAPAFVEPVANDSNGQNLSDFSSPNSSAFGSHMKHLMPVYPVDDSPDDESSKTSRMLGRRRCWMVTTMTFLLLYLVYFAWCMYRCGLTSACEMDKDWWTLLILTCTAFVVVILILIYRYLWKPYIWSRIEFYEAPPKCFIFEWLIYGLIVISYLTFIFIDAILLRQDVYSLISLSGVFVILFVAGLTSFSRRQIRPRPIVIGLGLQFVFALVVMRWDLGRFVFEWLGNEVKLFISHADDGARFLFMSAWKSGDLAFVMLPIIPFFSAVTSVLYYLGWIQAVINGMAKVMDKLMGTTAGESMSCSANIFLGMAEAPLLIRPLLNHMTRSELHAVMTGGFATIAGSVMGAYIAMGVDSRHLLTASLMSAPTALALSKLVYPETEKSEMKVSDISKFIKGEKSMRPRNIVEAACEGASFSIPLVANIAVNLIAVISIISLMNSILTWFGVRAGLAPPLIDEPFTLEFIASYVFWPIAFLLGVPLTDCRLVGKLLGLKLFTNEFIAFNLMSTWIVNRDTYEHYYCDNIFGNSSAVELVPFPNGSYWLPEDQQTVGPIISRRAEWLATYALCGFAGMIGIGIQIGCLGALAENKKSILTAIVFRAMIAGYGVNLLNAATAGLLFSYGNPSWNSTCAEMTSNSFQTQIV